MHYSTFHSKMILWYKNPTWLFHIGATKHFVVVIQSPNHVWLFATPSTAADQSLTSPCPSPSPGVCPSLCPFNQWCYPIISSSVTLFSFCFQSFPALGSFPISQFFKSGSKSIEASASPSVLLMSIQGWFPVRMTGLSSLPSKRLSIVFSSTTVQKYQFFGILPSLWSSSHIHTWLLEIP